MCYFNVAVINSHLRVPFNVLEPVVTGPTSFLIMISQAVEPSSIALRRQSIFFWQFTGRSLWRWSISIAGTLWSHVPCKRTLQLPIAELRKMSSKASADKEKLTLGCALSVGIQCLEAIHELHDVGYLHRDVKPANFAIDKFDIRKIYLLDLGLCRKYVGRNGEVRRPRWAAGFRGTIRRGGTDIIKIHLCHGEISFDNYM
uniref:Protein kinase domain-containing protein n=1 Tax=Parascaris univalens TaxID=6257 RepID=A0A915A621_PARUN